MSRTRAVPLVLRVTPASRTAHIPVFLAGFFLYGTGVIKREKGPFGRVEKRLGPFGRAEKRLGPFGRANECLDTYGRVHRQLLCRRCFW